MRRYFVEKVVLICHDQLIHARMKPNTEYFVTIEKQTIY